MVFKNINNQIIIATIIALLFLNQQNCLAQFSDEQQNQINELKAIIDNKLSNDTAKAKAYVKLSTFFGTSNIDSMYTLSVSAQQIAEAALKTARTNDITNSLKISLASALSNIGYYFKNLGKFPLALENYQKSIKILEEINYQKGLGVPYNNIGLLYYLQGNIPLAIEYYHKSLKIRETINDKSGIAAVFNNLGSLYKRQNNIPLAIDFYTKCLRICEEIGDKRGLAYSYNNMGMLHFIQNDFPTAINYHERSLKLKEEIGDRRGISESYHNIAKTYQSMNSISTNKVDSLSDLAMNYFLKCLIINEEINDRIGMATTLNSIGQLYLSKGLYKKAKASGDNALTIAKEVGFVMGIQQAASLLYEIALQQKKWKEALEMRNLELQMKDSIDSEEAMNVAISLQAKYEYEKQQAIDNAEFEKLIVIEQEEKQRQKIITYTTGGGLALVVLFLVFVFNRLQVTRKQKIIIEEKEKETQKQKEIIEEKHKEITDSINYAERIQRSFLATTEMLDKYLGVTSSSPKHGGVSSNEHNYFVFFRPKDVVSGDFYWASELNNGHFAYCCADSTGHGVPGAIMSILNISSLEKAIEIEVSPDQILNKTRKIIIERLKKDGSLKGGKDGMDCSLLVLDKERKKLSFALANSPVFIVRSVASSSLKQEGISRSDAQELLEFKADKMPVGKHEKDTEPFNLHTIQLQLGDTIYTLTDGFSDQFGGAKNKKYMIKNVKEMFLQIAHLPMSEQKQKLSEAFDQWKGSNEQIDDVCIIGVRI
ncbi:MAG: tetratricopeptide repeat protein [Flavobacteriales bacterium]|nr:tetratricopeptide repeat protein [Flavobacteriales bacterium]